MVDPQVAYDKLCNFQTSQELREYFQQENIKGILGISTMCPIANWFQDTIDVGNDVDVEDTIMVFHPNGDIQRFEHTEATSNFISKFDCGLYPELISGNPGGN